MGCVMSTAIAVLLCKHRCSIERLTSSMSFHPPSPPSYSFESTEDGSLKLIFANHDMAAALLHMGRQRKVRCELKLLRTSRRQSIPLFHFICEGARMTVLWSHANAMDCGEMYFFFIELAARLNVNVAAYDYSGYGAATGQPTESNAYSDARAAFDYLVSTGIDAETQIILYGQSIGSAPTLYLATKRKYAAVILHTPILSGLRFLIPPPPGVCTWQGCCSPRCVYAPCDPFPNFKRIRRVSAPVLLIHGTADRTVHYSHSLTLYERLPPQHRREPYIIEGAGHENIVDYDVDGYFRRVQAFLSEVTSLSSNGRSSDSAYPMASRTATVASAPLTRARGDGIDLHTVNMHPSCEQSEESAGKGGCSTGAPPTALHMQR